MQITIKSLEGSLNRFFPSRETERKMPRRSHDSWPNNIFKGYLKTFINSNISTCNVAIFTNYSHWVHSNFCRGRTLSISIRLLCIWPIEIVMLVFFCAPAIQSKRHTRYTPLPSYRLGPCFSISFGLLLSCEIDVDKLIRSQNKLVHKWPEGNLVSTVRYYATARQWMKTYT